MSSGMPELGSKISLISKADIRYEGRLFTVDPQECTIALASVRSFGTEDRETQYPVAPQSQVYDYILFRGTDIKDIRVLNNVPSIPNDPAIVQMSIPPSLGGSGPPGQYSGQYNHPVVGQSSYPTYHPMAGFPGGVHAQLSKTSELSPQTPLELTPQPQHVTAPIGSGVIPHSNQVKDQAGSMLDLISGGSQQSASRSGTPSVGAHRKSPTTDQGTQVSVGTSGSGQQQRDSRRGSAGAVGSKQQPQQRNRTNSRNRQRYPSGGQPAHNQQPHHQQSHQQQPHQQQPHQQQPHHQQQHQPQHQSNQSATQQHHHHQTGQGYNRGGWRGRARGRGRGFITRNKNTLKFENDYDFEQANTEFEELRSQLAKTKISDGDVKPEPSEVDKKDDSGNETGAGEPEVEEDAFPSYNKSKSFFDNISCESVERSMGRSQRTDWRTERKLNSETFGVASARRGAWRGRPAWRHHAAYHNNNTHHNNNPHHQQWRAPRGGRGRGGMGGPSNSLGTGPGSMSSGHMPRNNMSRNSMPSSSGAPQPHPPVAAAK